MCIVNTCISMYYYVHTNACIYLLLLKNKKLLCTNDLNYLIKSNQYF